MTVRQSAADALDRQMIRGKVSDAERRLATHLVMGTLRRRAWIDHVLSFINISGMSPFKVAIDTGNGMAGKIIPQIATKLPLDITPMYFELDGSFPNHPANPLEPENVADLKKKGRKELPDWAKIMIIRHRKTLVLCKHCHTAIHTGKP